MIKEYKYLFGSKLLNLENARDEDWLIYMDASPKEIRAAKGQNIRGCVSIPFTRTLLKHFSRVDKVHVDPFKALYLYQLSTGFFAELQDYVFKDFNIFEYKIAWMRWLKAYINSEQANNLVLDVEVLPKVFYHLLYQYYMIKENTHRISEEAKAEVQKIHDLEVPAEYFEHLKELINSL